MNKINPIAEHIKGLQLQSKMFDNFFAQFEGENLNEEEPTLPEDGDNETIEESLKEMEEEKVDDSDAENYDQIAQDK